MEIILICYFSKGPLVKTALYYWDYCSKVEFTSGVTDERSDYLDPNNDPRQYYERYNFCQPLHHRNNFSTSVLMVPSWK